MVTRSIDDYEQWKDDVKKHYLDLFPGKDIYIGNFIKYTSSVYDSYERSYVPYQLIWYMYHKRKRVINNNQHFWFAVIGQSGGEGKSTLSKNILHFMDPTFDPSRAAMNYEEFLLNVLNTKDRLKLDYPGLLLDEPDGMHHMTREAMKMKNITTKVRQLNMIVGVCANSLNEIPSFIYERLTCIIHLNSKHRGWLYDNDKDQPKGTIIQEIKKEFRVKGHAVFKDNAIRSRSVFPNFEFPSITPFDESGYLKNKKKDVLKDIKDFFHLKDHRNFRHKENNVSLVKRIKDKSPNVTNVEIANVLGITRQHVSRVKNQLATFPHMSANFNNKKGDESNQINPKGV